MEWDGFPHGCKPAPPGMAPFSSDDIAVFQRLRIRDFDLQAWHGSKLVQALSYAGKGLYLELLLQQSQDGSVAWDPVLIAAAGKMAPEEFGQAWLLLRRAFVVLLPGDPDRLANPKMHQDLIGLLEFSRLQTARIQKRWTGYQRNTGGIEKRTGGMEKQASGIPRNTELYQGGGEGGGGGMGLLLSTNSGSDTTQDSETHTVRPSPNGSGRRARVIGGWDEFKKAWPWGEGLAKAEAAFRKINPDRALLDEIILGIAAYAASERVQRGVIMLPGTFLNGRRWRDQRKATAPAQEDYLTWRRREREKEQQR